MHLLNQLQKCDAA